MSPRTDGTVAAPAMTGADAGSDRPSGDPSPLRIWEQGEPRLSDLLADPIVQLIMRRDAVTAEALAAGIDALLCRKASLQAEEK